MSFKFIILILKNIFILRLLIMCSFFYIYIKYFLFIEGLNSLIYISIIIYLLYIYLTLSIPLINIGLFRVKIVRLKITFLRNI